MTISLQLYRIRICNYCFIQDFYRDSRHSRGNALHIRILIFSILIFSSTLNHNVVENQQSSYSNIHCIVASAVLSCDSFQISCYYLRSVSWAYFGLSNNKLFKIYNGNRSKSGYKFAIWNCGRGLLQDEFSPKLTEIKQFIEKRKPHCMGIIEADLFGLNSEAIRKKYSTEEIKEKLQISGYNIELPSSWEKYGQARLFCYVSEEVRYQRKELDNTVDHLPTITLEVGFGKATKIIVHFFYREWTSGVTGESDARSQNQRLEQHLGQWESLLRSGKQFIALGDANLCALHWYDSDYRLKSLANVMQTFLLRESCFQIVNKYTRIQSVAGRLQRSCLDQVITNVPEKCNIPEVYSSLTSDHLPVMVTKYSREIRHQPRTVKKRNYKSFIPHLFLSDIHDSYLNGKFDQIINSENIDEASAIFSGLFGSILNKHAPMKVYQVRHNYVPWISEETKRMQEVRDALKQEAKNEGCYEKYNSYKRIRNRISSRLEKDKKDYFRSKFYSVDTSTKNVWNQANRYLNKTNNSGCDMPSIILSNGTVHTSPLDIANSLNKTFLKKVSDLIKSVSSRAEIDPIRRLQRFLDKRDGAISQFHLKKIDAKKLRDIIKRRKGNRSCGFDCIDGYSLKLAAPIIEDVILHLVNLSIMTTTYPRTWKINKITPRFKKGDKLQGENWRPVTEVVFISKIVEAAVHEQVSEHFGTNKLWHPNHHGFKSNHSTITALSQLCDLWIKAAEDRKLTAALLLDLSAAFDVINHSILLEKLRLYNFSPGALSWFKSYLEDRIQAVQVESRLSDFMPIGDQGITQGSLLGPLLFIIFYNDFPDVREEGESILYADDDTDNVSDNDPNTLIEKIQREADLSTSWVKDNKMVCSGAKTKLMIIGTRELRNSKLGDSVLDITVDGCTVRESDNEKLLGVRINNTLTWHHHLYGNDKEKGLVNKLSHRVALLLKLSKVMPRSQLRIISEGLFFSLLNYGIEVFGNIWGLHDLDENQRKSIAFTKDDNMRLQVLVNKVLRLISGEKWDTPVIVLHRKTKQLSVHQRTAMFTLMSTQKVLLTSSPEYHSSRLSGRRLQQVNNRGRSAVHIDYRLSLSRGSFFYRCTRIYAKLPIEMRLETNMKTFRRKLKLWVFENVPLMPP